MHADTIRTERLVLRELRPEDAMQLHRNCSSDPAVVQYLERDVCYDPKVTREAVLEWIDMYNLDFFFLLAIEYEGQVIGTINLHGVDRERGRCEIGYSIGSEWWNMGIMTEAAGAVVNYVLDDLGFRRITGWCAAENKASARVMEKIGMKLEGCMKESILLSSGDWADQLWYAIERDDGEETE